METRNTWLALLLATSVVYCMVLLSSMVVAIFAEQVKVDFQLTDRELGYMMGSWRVLVSSVLVIALALLSDRLNNTRVLGCIVVIFACAVLSASYVGSFSLLLVATLTYFGFGAAVLPIALATLFSGRNHIWLATIIGAVVSLQGIVNVAAIQVYDLFEWPLLLRTIGGVALVCGVAILFVRYDSASLDNTSKPLAFNLPIYWLAALAVLLAFSVGYAVNYWGAPMLLRATEMSVTEVVPWLTISVVGLFVGRIFGGVLTDVLVAQDSGGYGWVGLIGSSIMAVSLASLFWFQSLYSMVAVITLVAFAAGMLYPMIIAMTIRLAGTQFVATSLAVMLVAVNLGLLLGPMLVGAISDSYTNTEGYGASSLQAAFVWLIIPALAAGVFFALVAVLSKPGMFEAGVESASESEVRSIAEATAFKPPQSSASDVVVQVNGGFSWLAFFFGPIWAWTKGMVGLGFGLLLGNVVVNMIATVFGAMAAPAGTVLGIFIVVGWLSFVGLNANTWLKRSLLQKGYEPMRSVGSQGN